jgi:hypothetical protein
LDFGDTPGDFKAVTPHLSKNNNENFKGSILLDLNPKKNNTTPQDVLTWKNKQDKKNYVHSSTN